MAINKSRNKSNTKIIYITKTELRLRRTKVMYAGLVLVAILFLGMAGYLANRAIKLNTNKVRLNEIIAVYDSLKLDESYRATATQIFGDKRVYDYDRGRTFASKVEYGHNATPAFTRAEVRKKVEAAGFKYVQTEYEGSIQPIDEFINSKGNYVRVGVMSVYVRDGINYGGGSAADPLIMHKDEPPAYLSIWVNLDDNNE